MTDEPGNSHVMPMQALYLGGLLVSVMCAAGRYLAVFKGMRVGDRSTGGDWTLPETLVLDVGLFAFGILAA